MGEARASGTVLCGHKPQDAVGWGEGPGVPAPCSGANKGALVHFLAASGPLNLEARSLGSSCFTLVSLSCLK